MAELNRHRYDNAIRVLEALWRKRRMSRADLARVLRLNRSTTGSLVDYLLGMELLNERPSDVEQRAGTRGGRPPLLVGLESRKGYAIGLDIRCEGILAIASDLFGHRILENEYAVECGAATLVASVHTAISRTVTAVHRDAEDVAKRPPGLVAVGVGVSGIVDGETGAIRFSRALEISDSLDLASQVAAAAPAPVFVFNDADACALGELEFVRSHERDLLFVLGSFNRSAARAGLGIILDGNLRQSHSGAGREFRSPFANPNSSEQFAVSELLSRGEVSSEEAFERFSDELSVSVAFLVHALDLRNIVLGGDLSYNDESFSRVEAKVRDHVRGDTVRRGSQPLDLRRAETGDRSVAFGACAGALRKSFETRRFPLFREALV